jgi:hypothetical protein
MTESRKSHYFIETQFKLFDYVSIS